MFPVEFWKTVGCNGFLRVWRRYIHWVHKSKKNSKTFFPLPSWYERPQFCCSTRLILLIAMESFRKSTKSSESIKKNLGRMYHELDCSIQNISYQIIGWSLTVKLTRRKILVACLMNWTVEFIIFITQNIYRNAIKYILSNFAKIHRCYSSHGKILCRTLNFPPSKIKCLHFWKMGMCKFKKFLIVSFLSRWMF